LIVNSEDGFDKWLDGLKDHLTKVRLIHRLDKVRQGLPGDVKSVGDGVFEMI